MSKIEKVKDLIQLLSSLDPEARLEIYQVHAPSSDWNVGAGPEKFDPKQHLRVENGIVTIIGGSVS